MAIRLTRSNVTEIAYIIGTKAGKKRYGLVFSNLPAQILEEIGSLIINIKVGIKQGSRIIS